ncbi:MAG: DUF262 domain-containing protein [Acidobacteria bacterium]|nr:DUF262 domain-containing protein [Acidobacteriota bacterium]
MKKIDGEAKTVRKLLAGAKYAIDYYQREFKWQTKQVTELIDDLASKFLQDFRPSHERSEVADYGHYFLGSIIISHKNGHSFIIDGQQRLTTLTLMLIHLHNLQKTRTDKVPIDELIFSEKFAKKSFNLDVEERRPCMEALFAGHPFDDTDQPESVRNILARYHDIQQYFPDDLVGEALPYFLDWLIENVHLVEITAYTDEDAYTIFETMNDRGLSLSPTDMLKGFLLANITDEQKRLDANAVWKERVGTLIDLGKDEDADAVKTWLRSQYAQTIRERKKGALPGDFDRLGTEFHRWVREHQKDLGLKKSAEFVTFIARDFAFYATQYLRLRQASQQLTTGLETIFYNARHDFTLQYPLLLSPLKPDDSDELINKKLRIVAAFVDILLARRLWNFRSIAYSTVQYSMFLVMRDIRGKSPRELVTILKDRLESDGETFASNDRFALHQQNRHTIQQLLARMVDHVERESGLDSHFMDYIAGKGKHGYEVEHIWADKFSRHRAEFDHPADFAEYRNRFGGLLLLPKTFNASFGDLTYEKKLEHYFGQNILAKSLHPNCYKHNPGFAKYAKASGLPFQPHKDFLKTDLDARHELYRQLAEQIWNPSRLGAEAQR